MFAMSAKLLYSALLSVVIGYIAVAAANDEQTGSVTIRRDLGKMHVVVVEEVDGNGQSVVKELELPSYDDSEELRRDEERRREQLREFNTTRRGHRDIYGCDDTGSEAGQKKCLQMRRRWLRSSYRNWREAIRRVMNDIDARIRNLNAEIRKDTRKVLLTADGTG